MKNPGLKVLGGLLGCVALVASFGKSYALEGANLYFPCYKGNYWLYTEKLTPRGESPIQTRLSQMAASFPFLVKSGDKTYSDLAKFIEVQEQPGERLNSKIVFYRASPDFIEMVAEQDERKAKYNPERIAFYEHPFRLLQAPFKPGTRWETYVRDPYSPSAYIQLEAEIVIVGDTVWEGDNEPIVDCLVVRLTQKGGTGYESYVWFAPKIGIVKRVITTGGDNVERKLVRYNVSSRPTESNANNGGESQKTFLPPKRPLWFLFGRF